MPILVPLPLAWTNTWIVGHWPAISHYGETPRQGALEKHQLKSWWERHDPGTLRTLQSVGNQKLMFPNPPKITQWSLISCWVLIACLVDCCLLLGGGHLLRSIWPRRKVTFPLDVWVSHMENMYRIYLHRPDVTVFPPLVQKAENWCLCLKGPQFVLKNAFCPKKYLVAKCYETKVGESRLLIG